MLKALLTRAKQGHRTMRYPKGDPPPMPDHFRGLPEIDQSKCINAVAGGWWLVAGRDEAPSDQRSVHESEAVLPATSHQPPSTNPLGTEHRALGTPSPLPATSHQPPATPCSACADVCPTDAIDLTNGVSIDLGRCIFCPDCEAACPEGAIKFTRDYRLAVRRRDDLRVGSGDELALAEALDKKLKKLFGRSLKLRVVSAGDCNGCAADVNVLSTIGWDIGRFGIQYVASPRHADGLVLLGPIPENMRLAVQKTWDAIPAPKLVIAIGACAISGGIYSGHPEQHDGVASMLPVDLFIPGCPPHPLTILDGLLRLLGRIEEQGGRGL